MLTSPSLLSADFGRLNDDIDMLNDSDADYLHLDIMDGVFVPNISFGFPVLKYVAKRSKKPLDAHLMIVEPQKFVNEVKNLGCEYMTVHQEACVHLDRVVNSIKEAGMKAGVALNPATPVDTLRHCICSIDMVLVMSVNPGFGGQPFIENTYNKIAQLKEMLLRKNSNALIEVDGGVNANNAPKLLAAGADVLVAGQYVFGSKNPHEAIRKLLQ